MWDSNGDFHLACSFLRLTPGSAQYLCVFLARLSDVTHRRPLKAKTLDIKLFFQINKGVLIRISTKKIWFFM